MRPTPQSLAAAFVAHARRHACYGEGCSKRGRLYAALAFACKRDYARMRRLIDAERAVAG